MLVVPILMPLKGQVPPKAVIDLTTDPIPNRFCRVDRRSGFGVRHANCFPKHAFAVLEGNRNNAGANQPDIARSVLAEIFGLVKACEMLRKPISRINMAGIRPNIAECG